MRKTKILVVLDALKVMIVKLLVMNDEFREWWKSCLNETISLYALDDTYVRAFLTIFVEDRSTRSYTRETELQNFCWGCKRQYANKHSFYFFFTYVKKLYFLYNSVTYKSLPIDQVN